MLFPKKIPKYNCEWFDFYFYAQ